MADTIPDISVLRASYVDVNTLTGIAAGTKLILSNKSTSRIRLQIAAAQPAASSVAGEIIWPGPAATSIKEVTAGENTVWAISLDVDAPLSVQDNT